MIWPGVQLLPNDFITESEGNLEMPFRLATFRRNIGKNLDGPVREAMIEASQDYETLSTPQQKASFIRDLMISIDDKVDEASRWRIMEDCGRNCIGASILEKALALKKQSTSIDDLMTRLNQTHIGGGHLIRDGNVIHASYDRCYCGSVSSTRQPISSTYCHCSCGWYRQLFETLLNQPVKVELLSSILQGDKRCQFLIHLSSE
jgi:predicted hydrocarbon binding protein